MSRRPSWRRLTPCAGITLQRMRQPEGATPSRTQSSDLLSLAMFDPIMALDRTTSDHEKLDGPDGVLVLRSWAVANGVLGNFRDARRDLEVASQSIEGDSMRRAAVRAAAGFVDHLEGNDQKALAELSEAIDDLEGSELAWALSQRGAVNYELGDFAAARKDLDVAIAVAHEVGCPASCGRAALARSELHVRDGDLESAHEDLRAAHEWFTQSGHRTAAAVTAARIGRLVWQSGDHVGALNFLDDVDEALQDVGDSAGAVWKERTAAYLAMRLNAEAEKAAATALEHHEASQYQERYLDALIVAAQASLAAGKTDETVALAAEAESLAREQQRTGWEVFARYIALRARFRSDHAKGLAPGDVGSLADSLAEAGLLVESTHCLLIGAWLANADGDDGARCEFLVQASARRKEQNLEVRALGWVATTRLRLRDGNTRGAASAARAGLRLIGSYQAVLGTLSGLHVAEYAAELFETGLQLAAASGSPRRLFGWLELDRMGAAPLGRNDPDLRSRRAALHQANDELRRAVLAGRANRSSELRRNLLQEEVAQFAGGRRARLTRDLPTAESVLHRLGDAALVSLAVVSETLIAIKLEAGRARQIELGPVARIQEYIDTLHVSLRRIAGRVGSDASKAAALETLAATAARLDCELVEPLGLGGSRLVVVPRRPALGLPWSLLPSLADTEVVVVPSARLWMDRATRRTIPRQRVALIAGPGLAHSVDEIERLAQVYRHAQRLVEPPVEDVARSLEAAAIAHFACHGTLRADNPSFSSLEMADGPLTIYDLEAISQSPEIVVLSACDAGASAQAGGHEVMGLAAALLEQGTRSVVANVGLVPDQLATIELMVAVHENLAAGDHAATALSRALPELNYEDPDAVAARAFVTFGG